MKLFKGFGYLKKKMENSEQVEMEWASVTLCSLIFSDTIFFYPKLLLLLYFAPIFIVNLDSKI